MKRAAFFTPLLVVVSCREPTQIVIDAKTNVTYRSGIVTSFTVGGPGQTEKAEPTTETSEAWNGSTIGSLVVVPGSADDATLAVKLVMGVARNARECVAPDYQGCIVARRRLRYVPHEKLRLPITLYAQCQDVPCDELSTCSVLGQCVSVEPACADGTCELPGEPRLEDDGGVSVGVDGGGRDAASDGATTDASFDGGGDAGKDAATDGGSDGSSGGDGFVECSSGPCPRATHFCCFDGATNTGSCVANGTPCNSGKFPFTCESHSDCAANEHCCVNGSGAQCSATCTMASWMCWNGSNSECPNGSVCNVTFGGFYKYCGSP